MRTRIGSGRHHLRAVAMIVLALALIASACGDDDDAATTTAAAVDQTTTTEGTATTAGGDTATTAPATTAPPTTAAPPAEPQVMVFAFPGVPGTLHPNQYQGELSNDTYESWSGTLVRYKRLDDQTALQGPNDIEAEIAESWTVNDEGNITFTLREAMSPFGNVVDTEDVVWSFARMKEFDPVVGFLFRVGSFDLDNLVTVIDDRTFTVNVLQPNILTLRTLIWGMTSILDSTEALSHATAEDPWANDWLANNTAGYGPYYVTEDGFVPSESILVKANPNYWRGKPFFDELIFRAIPESSSRLQLLLSGDVDFANGLSFSDFVSAEGSGEAQTYRSPILNHDIMYLNFAYEPFNNPLVREAVSLALDREAMVQAAYQGVGVPAVSFIDADLPGPKVSAEEEFKRDPEAAKALLAEAGYPDGFAFELVAHNGRPGPQAEPLAILIKDQLADIGLDVTINLVASSADYNAGRAFGEDGSPPPFQAWLDTASPIIADTAYYGALLFASGSGAVNNKMGYANDAVDQHIADALSLPDGPERDGVLLALAQELQTTWPLIALVETIDNLAFGKDIGGYYLLANNRIYPALFYRESP